MLKITFWALQIHSSAKSLKLVTFDADGTLYADGCHMEHDNEMVSALFLALYADYSTAHVKGCSTWVLGCRYCESLSNL